MINHYKDTYLTTSKMETVNLPLPGRRNPPIILTATSTRPCQMGVLATMLRCWFMWLVGGLNISKSCKPTKIPQLAVRFNGGTPMNLNIQTILRHGKNDELAGRISSVEKTWDSSPKALEKEHHFPNQQDRLKIHMEKQDFFSKHCRRNDLFCGYFFASHGC